uniref:Uncharacterized protein n=1 Tax=Glycine max TaxID=3847 RepID=A0A0R0KEM4_SOYBN
MVPKRINFGCAPKTSSNIAKPLNKRNVYITRTSPPSVYEAYFEHFEKGFQTFSKITLRVTKVAWYYDIVIVLKKLDKWLKQKDLFTIETLKTIKIGWDANLQEDVDDFILNSKMRGELITKTIRAVFEPLLSAEFGEGIIDELFLRYAKLVAQLIEVETLEHTNVVVPMTKHS